MLIQKALQPNIQSVTDSLDFLIAEIGIPQNLSTLLNRKHFLGTEKTPAVPQAIAAKSPLRGSESIGEKR